jgi:hypothetical protein
MSGCYGALDNTVELHGPARRICILGDIIALCNLCLLYCADFGEGDLSGPCELAS